MKISKIISHVAFGLMVAAGLSIPATGLAQSHSEAEDAAGAPVRTRVVEVLDENRKATLLGNTHPMARPAYDKGRVEHSKLLERMVLVLQRSPEQQKALDAFNERQQDPASPDFHRWLEPEEFGRLYGPSDSDIAAVTSWLANRGFRIDEVSPGRINIEFTGTVAQVESAFHVQMHNYEVEGEAHIANDRDPQIPRALAPVITGVASLHDFFPKPQFVLGQMVKRNVKTGEETLLNPPTANSATSLEPQTGYTDLSGNARMDVSPWDFATIYNELPLWNAATPINGTGVTIAIAGVSDVNVNDFNLFRSSFGLPASTLVKTFPSGNPGYDTTGGQGENTLDVEWSGASAPGATINLVTFGSTATTFGGTTAINYIIQHNLAPIISASYGGCELSQGTAGNAAMNTMWQEAATEGISSFVSAGDQGSAGCSSQDVAAPNEDKIGLQVNGMASPPDVTAVGGTDLNWQWWVSGGYSTYWSASNSSTRESALGYIPEVPWNSTCASTILLDYVFTDSTTGKPFTSSAALCNAAYSSATYQPLVVIGAGSGGVSHCTTSNGTAASSCSGGYAKPSWQSVTGVPADGKRDLPDVSLFASGSYPADQPGSAYLFCMSTATSNGCDYVDNTYIIYQEIGGTSASSPAMAGIMALVIQNQGGKRQGLANPNLYKLASKETYANCSTNSVSNSTSTCVFNDIVSGSIAQVCVAGDLNCVIDAGTTEAYGVLSGYSAGVGYDLTTGLGSINVKNLVTGWASLVATEPQIIVSPAIITLATTAVGSTSPAQAFTVTNTGGAAATIAIALGGTNPTDFVKMTTCGSTLAAGASCSVYVAFQPLATGSLNAVLTVTDNAAGSPQTVRLYGTGTGAAAITLSATSLAFPTTTHGTTSALKGVTITDSGTGLVVFSSVALTGTNPSAFIALSSCGVELAPATSCYAWVAFAPATTGTFSANLTFTDSVTGSPQTVSLTGTAN